jgi:hypothetical protein
MLDLRDAVESSSSEPRVESASSAATRGAAWKQLQSSVPVSISKTNPCPRRSGTNRGNRSHYGRDHSSLCVGRLCRESDRLSRRRRRRRGGGLPFRVGSSHDDRRGLFQLSWPKLLDDAEKANCLSKNAPFDACWLSNQPGRIRVFGLMQRGRGLHLGICIAAAAW